ncbi:hypothetical protein RRG08_010523 [Elysia crispata]|uniref:Uncharacterized protein n=1 Tax=Elysia crispata TaxID=231223 RepID=A0AAE1ANT2_9GAST|nr:hypothetical protein RRG08_010523 [Elysia crispata]
MPSTPHGKRSGVENLAATAMKLSELTDVGPTSAEPLPRMTKLWNYCDLHQPAGSSSGSCLVKPGAAQVPSISSSPLFPVPSPLIRSLNALNMSKEKTQTKAV